MLKTSSWNLYRRLLTLLLPYRRQILAVLVSLLLTAATEPLMPILLKYLIDDTLIAGNARMSYLIPLGVTLLFFLKGVTEYIGKVASSWVAHQAIFNLRTVMFKKLVALPLATHHRYTSGKLLSKITYDVPQIATSLAEAWIIVIRDCLIILGLLGYLTYLSWKLTLLTLIIGPLAAWAIDRASRMMRQSSLEMQNSMGRLTQQIDESLNGYRDIRIYGAEKREVDRLSQTAETLRQHTMRVIRVAAANVPLVQILAAIALSLVIYVASSLSRQGDLSPGEFIAFITAMALIFEPIRRLTSVNQSIQQGLAAAQSIFELLDQPDEPNPGTLTLDTLRGDLQFNQVSFTYPTRDQESLKEISLRIPAGQTTALVGASGSGKTTLVNLLARFYPLSSGQIEADSIPIEQFDLNYWREQIAFVSQNVVLFNDTIRANIAFGNLSNDEEKIIQAARDAHALDFIEQLPDGFDTLVGDNGALLSGGQRQRLAIARAFLKDAPILIFDEATASLDNQSETMIQHALERLRQNRTVIVIAHRLSTIENADQIAVLDEGRLVELGTHQDLMVLGGVYFQLYQQGALLNGDEES